MPGCCYMCVQTVECSPDPLWWPVLPWPPVMTDTSRAAPWAAVHCRAGMYQGMNYEGWGAASSQYPDSSQVADMTLTGHWSPASDHLSTESCLPQPGAGCAAWIQLSQEMVIMSWQGLVAGGWCGLTAALSSSSSTLLPVSSPTAHHDPLTPRPINIILASNF